MKSGAWYTRFFSPEYWAVARYEYTAERTRAEVDYLESVLRRRGPGRRVIDLGCGTGRHAIELARRGFEVTGLDVSDWALEQAAAGAAEAGVEVRWHRVDLLTERRWPVEPADAAICLQAFGWGTDAEQVAFLRTVRAHLRPGDGLLVLDHSNVNAILGAYVGDASFAEADVSARFHRAYDPVGGRSAGWIDVGRPGRESVRIHDDVRLYQPAEVRRMLEESGFAVDQVTADFHVDQAPDTGSRYVQFLARSRGAPRDPLTDYTDAPDTAGLLDLRWSPDEFSFVEAELTAAWRETVERSTDGAWETARRYALTDPYGGARCAPVLSGHLGVPLTAEMVTCGAGATGLLHAAALLAPPRPVLHGAFGHPALPRWASALGSPVVPFDPARARELIAEHRPALVALDRPNLLGDYVEAAEVARMADAAADVGGLVVVDEAYATYAGPGAGLAPAVRDHDNLIVIRSMSKGYCCGGLRIGFALTSPATGALLRSVAPPLAAGELPLAVSLAMLRRGDVLAPLRGRIHETKPWFVRALRGAGFDVRPGDPDLPWVTVRADPRARAVLADRGILAKEIPGSVVKLAVPLSGDRLSATGDALGVDAC